MARARFFSLVVVVGLASQSLSSHAATAHVPLAAPRFKAVAFDCFVLVTADALRYSTKALNLELTAESEPLLLDGYLHLTPWPDAFDALSALKRSGVRVIALSNLSPMMLRANAEHANLVG